MRKVSSILLIFIYLVTITGISLTIHNCQGKTAYTFLGITLNKTCKCSHGKAKHSSNCCNNKKIVVEKNNTDNFAPKESVEVKLVTFYIGVKDDFIVLSSCRGDLTINFYHVKAPPDISSSPLYLMNRVILI